MSAEAFVKDLSEIECTIEEAARIVFDECSRVLGDIPLRVTVFARTTVHAPTSAEIQRYTGEYLVLKSIQVRGFGSIAVLFDTKSGQT